ncbi:LCP family protein [Dactylosporangium fulvum]|uniref:LCP family protein n=1 Tax=Dactylosporangium fulvum TaxID=53359 RepID=A0ABY5WCC9_9ACTN|nr:LCP family protein [Dactylosporangium fulvum]UWP87177.1 LCP family protein [Dactylosporangium fulvum]
MTRRQARSGRSRKDPLWARLSLLFGALLLVASGGVLVGGKVLLDHYSGQITHEGGLGDAAAEGASIDGPINLLLVGIDERVGNEAMGVRADSIIIAHVPSSHDAVYLTSIPRDTRVQIPSSPKTKYDGGTGKINSAFQFGYQNGGGRDGGLELLARTVSSLVGGLKFNGAAIVNFDGFKGLVDALGGVHMCVDEKVTSVHTGWDTRTGKEGVPYYFNADGNPTGLKPNMRPQIYEVGCYDMAAWEALDYVRQRDKMANNDGDYGRQRHQQQFIKAMAAKATSAGVVANPIKVNKVLNSVGRAVSFYDNNVELADWIFTLKGIKPDRMVTLKVNNGKFNSQSINGQWYEFLDDTAKELLTAIATNQVEAFVAAHPELISNDAAQPATSQRTGG